MRLRNELVGQEETNVKTSSSCKVEVRLNRCIALSYSFEQCDYDQLTIDLTKTLKQLTSLNKNLVQTKKTVF